MPDLTLMSETNTATVSISAVSGDAPSSLESTEAKLARASTLSIASVSTPSEPNQSNQSNQSNQANQANQASQLPTIVLLPAADIATSSKPKPATKPTVAAKKPLASTTKPSTLTSRLKPTSSLTKTPPATTPSSITSRARPPIPASLRGAPATSSTTTSRTTPTRPTTTTTTTASRLKPSPTTASTVRKSPSTPSLSTIAANRALASATRRVASSSGTIETASPSSIPSTRSPSRASTTSTSTTTTPATRRPITSSTVTANRTGATTTRTTTGTTPTTRRTPTSSTNPSPSSTIRSTTSLRASTAQATTPTTRPGASAASVITSRPIPDATKVKMLSTQLNGLQEKHDHTLKLLQEQEERLKRELEEMTVIPEQERKPIPSDTQDVLQEMEELRIQFKNANTQHQKELEDLATERAEEMAKIKEAHEMLLQAMTTERDSVSLALKSLQESGEVTEREKSGMIKELEEHLEATIEQRAAAVSEHAEAIEALRLEIENAWTLKLESKVQELTEEHQKALQSVTDKLVASDSSSQSQIKDLEESYALKLQTLQDDMEAKIAELDAHEASIQELQEKLAKEIESHQDAITLLGKEHSESLEAIKAELTQSQERNAELSSKLEEAETALETSRKLKDEVDAELVRAQNTAQDQIELVRQELQQIQKLLAVKEEETAELQKRIQELTDDLEHTSLGAMLKNNKKYKIKKVEIYGSSVSANPRIKRAQQYISDQFEHYEIEADFVDLAASEEAKMHIKRKSNGETALPQIFSDGDYRGTFEDFEYAIETHQLPQFLGFDRVRPFVPRAKDLSGYEYHSGCAQHGEDAEQGAGLPHMVVNGLDSKAGANNGSKNHNTATSMYLLSPASNRFHSTSSIASSVSSTSSMYSKKPGFVQAASQVWNGALEDEHGRTKHDLGFNSIIADDDELDELFEQGAVTEADLEAMLQSA